MRFFLNGSATKVEVIGEEVELPNSGGEKFAVHHAVIPSVTESRFDEDPPLFAVSHIGTGFRVAAGDSIDEAIEAAKQKLLTKTEGQIKAAISKAQKIVAEMAA